MINQNLKDIILTKKCVMWDFDGCFCASEQIHFLAYDKAFNEFNHKLDENDYYYTFSHLGGGVALEIKNRGLVGIDEEKIKHAKEIYYNELISKGHAQIFPQVPKIIHALNKKGISSAIVTNSPRSEILTILSLYTEPIELDFILGKTHGLRKKPAPDLYLAALEKTKFKPNEILVIEDSDRGLQAAYSAGFDALWIKTDLSQRFETNVPHLAKITHDELLTLVS